MPCSLFTHLSVIPKKCGTKGQMDVYTPVHFAGQPNGCNVRDAALPAAERPNLVLRERDEAPF